MGFNSGFKGLIFLLNFSCFAAINILRVYSRFTHVHLLHISDFKQTAMFGQSKVNSLSLKFVSACIIKQFK